MTLITQIGFGQVTVDDNVPVSGRYVGFDGFSGIPLRIENQGFPEIDISSAGTNKIAITQLPVWNGLNGLSRSRVQRTTLGLQGQTNLAWSMLHLWDDAAGTLPGTMQRDWMNVGTSYTSNIDFMYTGLLERPNTGGNNLATDAVVAWGCQPGATQNGNTDNFRFIFLQGLLGTPTSGSRTQQGLEMMRISPQGNVGIGDFSSNGFGLAEQPTFRLDVDGTARLRQVPFNDTADVFITGRQVDALGDYVLTYTPVEDFNFDDCRWVDVNSTTVIDEIDIFTGVPTGDENCDRGKVGIGVEDVRRAKLEVENLITRDEINAAIYGGTDMELQGGNFPNFFYGVYGETTNAQLGNTASTCGVKGFATTSRYQVGVFGESTGVQSATGYSIGVAGLANGTSSISAGVYGESIGGASPGGFFLGGVTSSGSPLIISDEQVKSNIQNIENASELISQLTPRTYSYVSPANREIPFDEGMRFGFIAQELQEVIPQLVRQATVPERIDSTGFVEGTGVELLGIQYSELIPILIAGFQEQNAEMAAVIEENQSLETEVAELSQELTEQANLIAELQEQMNNVMESFQSTQSKMNNCCEDAPVEKDRSETGAIELEQNFPNPFDVETTINFTIHERAQIRLEISDANGRVLDVLVNGQLNEGQYTERWDASAYAPGTYYYSLYADTELLTKKMIKR